MLMLNDYILFLYSQYSLKNADSYKSMKMQPLIENCSVQRISMDEKYAVYAV